MEQVAADVVVVGTGPGGMGAVAAAVNLGGKTRSEWCDRAARFGAEVIAKLPKH